MTRASKLVLTHLKEMATAGNQVVVARLMHPKDDPGTKSLFYDHFGSLMDIIRTQYVSAMITNVNQLDLTSPVRPKAILLVTSEITDVKYVKLRAALAKYVESGGTLVLCCWLVSQGSAWGIDSILWEFQCGWTIAEGLHSYTRTNLTLNQLMRRNFGDLAFDYLEHTYPIEARHIKGVSEFDQIYCPHVEREDFGATAIDMRSEAVPAAFRKHGKGMLGYVGDQKLQTGTRAVIVAMLEAVILPLTTKTDGQAFAGSSMTLHEHRPPSITARPTLVETASELHPPAMKKAFNALSNGQARASSGAFVQPRNLQAGLNFPTARSPQNHVSSNDQAATTISSQIPSTRRAGGRSTRRIHHLSDRNTNGSSARSFVNGRTGTSSVDIIADTKTNHKHSRPAVSASTVVKRNGSINDRQTFEANASKTTTQQIAPVNDGHITQAMITIPTTEQVVRSDITAIHRFRQEDSGGSTCNDYGGGKRTPSPHSDLSGPPVQGDSTDSNEGIINRYWDTAGTEVHCASYQCSEGAQDVAVEDDMLADGVPIHKDHDPNDNNNNTNLALVVSTHKRNNTNSGDMPPLAPCNPGCAVCTILTPANKCTGCRRVQYCSTACQKKDWRRHKAVCKLQNGSKNNSNYKVRGESSKVNTKVEGNGREDTEKTDSFTRLFEDSGTEDFEEGASDGLYRA